METVMSRVSRLLGLRLHSSNRPVHSVPQSEQTIPSNPTPAPVITAPTKKKRLPRVKLTESIEKVTKLRKQGLTYQAIGDTLKMSKQRVHQVISAHKRLEASKDLWTHGLSVRNTKLMTQLKINNPVTLITMIKSGDVRPFKYKNFGLQSYHDLCAWAGITPIEFRKIKTCPHCNKLI